MKTINLDISQRILNLTEKFYAGSIRFLLLGQPWLKCKTNCSDRFLLSDKMKLKCQTKRLLYVSNHRSNLDTFLLISWIPGLRGLAKSSLYYNIIFAPFMWITGFVPVEKGSFASYLNGLEKLKTKLLEKEIPVLIFPENTRCLKGSPKLSKWSHSIFKIAMDAKVSIIPVVIKNSDAVLGKGDFLLNPFQPMEVKFLEPIEATHFQDSIELSRKVHQMISMELK